MKYVIIGNSAAAAGCIEGIRQVDKQGGILVVAQEQHHIYSRPLISYLLCGKTDLQRMKYRGDDFYSANGCETMLGTTITAVHSASKKIVTESGQEIPYEKLLIATGSRPFVPETEGYESVVRKFTFMCLDDALALEKAITADTRVLIIGAGLIGLKCAEGIRDKVKDITVVDLAPRVLPSILDEEGSAVVQEHLEKQGLRLVLNAKAERFATNVAHLSNGEQVKFDILVMAAGVKPSVELFEGTINRGIPTNEKCETSIQDIYAAGDCTESMDISSDSMRVLALLPNAYMQGECAGINMAGGQASYTKAIPMNAIGFFGRHMITAGSYIGTEHVVNQEGNYKKLYVRNNRLMGYMMIGDVRRAGIYTALIRECTPLDKIDFELISEKPQLMAFSRKTRQQQLGGAV